MFKQTWFVPVAGLGLAIFAAHAQIATDGTVGPAQSLNGPNYAIGAGLGTQRGANLFHSFSTFSLQANESATFTGPAGLQNVISRVTGGELSTIDGPLRSEIGGANFFFINPAGVVFGANAKIDVPAAFHVSTADEIRFADGGVFSAATPGISTLSAAPPTAFGFLGPNRGRIGIEGSRLTFAPGSRVTVSAGEIAIRNGALVVEGGDLTLTALGETTGAVPVNEAFAETARGALTIENAGLDSIHPTLNVSGGGGGGLWLRAGETRLRNAVLVADNIIGGARDATRGIDINVGSLTAEGSWITSDTLADGAGGNVHLNIADTLTLLNGSLISASTFATGDAGDVTITARNLLADGQGSSSFLTGITSRANRGSTGAGGNVHLNIADTLTLLNGGEISAGTFAAGDAGDVTITARNLLIDRQGSKGFTGIASGANRGSTGAGGSVHLAVADTLTLLNSGQIHAGTFAAGDAGDVTITARNLLIDGQGSSSFLTGIASSAGRGSTGAGGSVHVEVADTLTLLNGGAIGASTFAAGDAGDVTITTRNLLIDGQGSKTATGIASSAEPGSTGAGGSIHLAVADTLTLLNGGEIGASTFAAGDAGNVTITASNLLIDGQGSKDFTGIASSTAPGSTGAGGSVHLAVADTLTLLNGGRISAATSATGNAGDVTISAGNLLIDGKDSDDFTGISSRVAKGATGAIGHLTVNADTLRLLNGGTITTASFAIRPSDAPSLPDDNLPNISITAREVELSNGSLITSAAFGNTTAGAIQLQIGERLTLDHATISTEANEGDGGPITIDGGDLLLRDSRITTSVFGEHGDGGDITLTPRTLIFDGGFIQANTAAANAKGGNIRIDTQTLLSPADQELRIGGQERETFQPGVNVIQAAAPQGESGTLDVTAPNLNLSSALAGMSNRYSDLSAAASDPCARRRGQKPSTLAAAGRGGIPADNRAEVTVSLAGGDWTPPPEPNAAATTRHETLALNNREECRL